MNLTFFGQAKRNIQADSLLKTIQLAFPFFPSNKEKGHSI
jgi:hypothetical protein